MRLNHSHGELDEHLSRLAAVRTTAAICGARSPEHVDGWIGAADMTIPSDALDEIESISSGWGGAEASEGESGTG